MRKLLLWLIVMALVIPAAGIAKKKEKDIMGTYSVTGYNPGISTSGVPSYTGTLDITQSGGAYILNWNLAGEKKNTRKGVGIYSDGILSVGLNSGGVINYGVEKNVLKGVWAPPAGGVFGYEICQKN